jgi:hypothetical protein
MDVEQATGDGKRRFWLRGAPIIHDTIDNETIAINQLTGSYYSLDGPSAAAWQLLAGGASAAAITDHLAPLFADDRGVLEAAVDHFLQQLLAEELIVADGQASAELAPASAPDTDAAARPPFPGLRLNRYTDLEVLLLADPIHEVDDSGWPKPLADQGR